MKYINPNEYGSLLFDEKEIQAITDTFQKEKIFRYASSKLSKVDIFESELKKFVGASYALGVVNGTAGLITALVGCGVSYGDRVLVSSYTFLATALAVRLVGAIPIPINIDCEQGVQLDDLENELKKGCKAVIVVQFQGRCFDLENVKKLVHQYGALLIEDSCQAFGARNKNYYAGTIGDVGVYSFQQFKQLSSGEGGAIVTNQEDLYIRMRNYSDMGSERDLFPNWDGPTVLFGQNYRMNNITGAILCEQMKKLPFILKKQRQLRNSIEKRLTTKRIVSSVYPKGDTGMNLLLLYDSKEQVELLKQRGEERKIEVRSMWKGLYFENDLFRRNHLTDKDLKDMSCESSKEFVESLAVLSIPPILTEEDCDEIVSFLNSFEEEIYGL